MIYPTTVLKYQVILSTIYMLLSIGSAGNSHSCSGSAEQQETKENTRGIMYTK